MIIRNKYKFLSLAILFAVYYYYPYKIEGIGYYNKIWAHRVNSLQKLNSALRYFDGIELDLVYNIDKDLLDVNHPPTSSIGLSFSEYLNTLRKDNFPYIWLDLKNINEKNAPNILKRLLLLFNSKNYPLHKILIESRRADQLNIFKNEGFNVTFYLPPNLYKKDSLSLSKSILEIKKKIKAQPNIAISTSIDDYDIIKKEFPNKTKYIWAIVRPIHFQHFDIRKVIKDKSVKVVLQNYNVINGNR